MPSFQNFHRRDLYLPVLRITQIIPFLATEEWYERALEKGSVHLVEIGYNGVMFPGAILMSSSLPLLQMWAFYLGETFFVWWNIWVPWPLCSSLPLEHAAENQFWASCELGKQRWLYPAPPLTLMQWVWTRLWGKLTPELMMDHLSHPPTPSTRWKSQSLIHTH